MNFPKTTSECNFSWPCVYHPAPPGQPDMVVKQEYAEEYFSTFSVRINFLLSARKEANLHPDVFYPFPNQNEAL